MTLLPNITSNNHECNDLETSSLFLEIVFQCHLIDLILYMYLEYNLINYGDKIKSINVNIVLNKPVFICKELNFYFIF